MERGAAPGQNATFGVAPLPISIRKGLDHLIRINKTERATIYKAYPELHVPRTATGKYWLSEEEKYLRMIPHNKDAAALLDVIDRRRERMRALDQK